MKIDDLLKNFTIFVTNEEKEILSRMESVRPIAAYTEREQFVIESLIKKSLVSKVKQHNIYMVVKNEQTTSKRSI
jgi:hypothetical protein